MSDTLSRIIKMANYYRDESVAANDADYMHVTNGAIKILYRLGLIEPDRESKLGWRANAQLEEIAAEAAAKADRKLRRKESEIDFFIISLLLETAGTNLANNERLSACFVLRVLGLVRDSRDGQFVVTRKLLRLLIEDTYHMYRRALTSVAQ